MKVKDEAAWLLQKAELARTDPVEIGELFLAILDEWAALAEREYEPRVALDSHDQLLWPPIQCLRHTLPKVEQNRGPLSGLWIFEMLLVMDTFWIHGGALYEALSGFEQAALGDVARSIMREAQEGAQTVPSGPEN